MEIRKVPLSQIVPYENNPRKNDGAVEAVAESIKQCGYRQKIIVDENMVVIAGHTRLKALKKLGWKEAEVQVETDMPEEKKRKYRLLDNKTNELAEWDEDKLREELSGLDFAGFDFEFPDFNIETGEAEEDEFDTTPPEEAETKPGDIWILGRHRLLCGDATDVNAVERLMDGKTADLYLTDPPYNVDYHGGTGLTIQNDNMEDAHFREFLAAAFNAAKTILKAGAAFYIWHADSEGFNFRGACRDAGLTVKQCLIWEKNALVLGRQDYQWRHEPCLYGWVDGASHAWYSDRKQTTILQFDRPVKNGDHPTMKPVKLFDYLIKNSTKAGDVVFDGFAGSGTTAVACEQDERTACLMELDQRYCDVIKNRWEALTGQKAVLLNG